MGAALRYCSIYRISLNSEKVGYEYRLVPTAQEFIQKIPNYQQGNIQAALNSYFYAKDSSDIATRARAGLCLRCYVSKPILKACQKIDSLFSGEKFFTYKDLLPYVLNDDGKTKIILDSDRKTQLILDENGTQQTAYKFFTVEVLRTFKPSDKSMSLDNWAYLQTKQNPELKNFLSEFGFQHLSDWALMNRARSKQLERLYQRDRHLVEVFHAVYRRDRQQQRQIGATRCPDPSIAQLQEMLIRLQERGVIINTPVELLLALKQVATQLRQYDIWSYREPLEIEDPDTGNYTPRSDLPTDSLNESDVEQQEVLELLYQQLNLALNRAIEQEIKNCIERLEKSKKYAPFAQQFIHGLQLYYCQAMSLKEIAPLLGMSSWDQARRVLNPGEIINKVRALTVQQILDKMLEKAGELSLTTIPPQPDYLKTLLEHIEAFVDAEVFQEAGEEIKAGKSRSLNSFYAQQLRLILSKMYQYEFQYA